MLGSFNVGGTIVSLNSLLSKLDTQKVEVDVFARQKNGDFLNKLPNCHILEENVWMSHSIYFKCAIVRYVNFLLLCIRKAFEIVGIDLSMVYYYIGGKQVGADKYDAIISYDETLPRYVSYMPAKKRITWIHCDYRRHAMGKDESKYYDKMDSVVCVAESMRKVFVDIYPQYADKTVAIHNIINVEDIIEKSKTPIDDRRFHPSEINFNHRESCKTHDPQNQIEPYILLSCGRLDPVKQFSLIPTIASKVKELTNKTFRWYIIGEGEDRNAIELAIKDAHMEDVVIMLGKKSNVYAYMAKVDAYVCTSSSEAHPLVVNEARALQKPVICNTFESAYESVVEGRDGHIVCIDDMPQIIVDMMQNPMVIDRCYINNENSLERIYNLF